MAVALQDAWPPDESLLTADQRASLWLGYIVRADVDVEQELRQLWAALVGGQHARLAAPPDWRSVFTSVQQLICDERVAPARDLRSLGSSILGAAEKAHALRNRLAHDTWFKDPYSVDAFRHPSSKARRDVPLEQIPLRLLAEFKSAHDALMRIGWRINALAFLTRDHLGDPDHVAWRDREPDTYANVMAQQAQMANDYFTVAAPGQALYNT